MMQKYVLTPVRLLADDVTRVEEIAAQTKVKPAVIYRKLIHEALENYDAKHAYLMEKIEELQASIAKLEKKNELVLGKADAGAMFAASAVSLLASLEIPRIESPDKAGRIRRIKDNMAYATELGSQVKLRIEAGEQI